MAGLLLISKIEKSIYYVWFQDPIGRMALNPGTDWVNSLGNLKVEFVAKKIPYECYKFISFNYQYPAKFPRFETPLSVIGKL